MGSSCVGSIICLYKGHTYSASALYIQNEINPPELNCNYTILHAGIWYCVLEWNLSSHFSKAKN